MKIIMRDGRSFEGTPLEIVRAMQFIAFGVADYTVPQYIRWVAANALKFELVKLEIKGKGEDELAASLVEEMIRTGLALAV